MRPEERRLVVELEPRQPIEPFLNELGEVHRVELKNETDRRVVQFELRRCGHACPASEPGLRARSAMGALTFQAYGEHPLPSEKGSRVEVEGTARRIVGETAFAIEFSRRLLNEGVLSPVSGIPLCRRGQHVCGFRRRQRSRRSTWSRH
jgi:hypothetical protein